MAKTFDLVYLPGVIVPSAYAMVAEVHMDMFNENCTVIVNIYLSEDARHQRLAAEEIDLHHPLRVITVKPPWGIVMQYCDAPLDTLVAAVYKLLSEVEESAAVSPHGLKTLFANAEDHLAKKQR